MRHYRHAPTDNVNYFVGAYRREDLLLCEHCYDRHYTICEDCSRIISQDDAYYSDDDDYAYCYDCFHTHNLSAIHDYSYKPDPIFYGNDDRFFGAELENDSAGKDGENAELILDEANRESEGSEKTTV